MNVAQVAESVLTQALEHLGPNGERWHQGSMWNNLDRYRHDPDNVGCCMLGAIVLAYKQLGLLDAVRNEVAPLITDQLNIHTASPLSLARFNDTKTFQEVQNVLLKARNYFQSVNDNELRRNV